VLSHRACPQQEWRKVKESNHRDLRLGSVFKTDCPPLGATFQNGCPGAIRTRDRRLRRAVLWSTELRDMIIGVPGYDPGRLQPSAAPAYKAEPHASADAVVMVRAAGFEPAISSVRGRQERPGFPTPCLKMATRSGYDPLSTHGQCVSHTSSFTGLELGARGPTRTDTGRLLEPLPLPLGYARVVDTPGNDPGPDRLRAGRSAH
jgi:hypothetical protein